MYEKHLILIVDDDNVFRSFVAKNIRRTLKARVDESTNPKEAFVKIKENIPDLIILDMEMPVMNGYEALKLIRKYPATKHIPVIPCTSLRTKDVVLKLLELKISDFIEKRAPIEVILEKVEKVLKQTA